MIQGLSRMVRPFSLFYRRIRPIISRRITAPMTALMISPRVPPPIAMPSRGSSQCDERADDPYNDIADEAEAVAANDQASHPAGDPTNDQPKNEFHGFAPALLGSLVAQCKITIAQARAAATIFSRAMPVGRRQRGCQRAGRCQGAHRRDRSGKSGCPRRIRGTPQKMIFRNVSGRRNCL